jgi:hypothetical protein
MGKPSFDLGTVRPALIASLSFSMISVGVFVGTPIVGARTPYNILRAINLVGASELA